MVWPFSRQPDLKAIKEAAASAAFQINEQLKRVDSQIAPERASTLAELNNLNGLIAGYALGIASRELTQKGKMQNKIENTIADEVQLSLKNFGYDIHISKHAEFQSYAFIVGVEVAGQETTNKYVNHQLWEDTGRRHNLLFEIINVVSDPFRVSHGAYVAELLWSENRS